MARTVTAPDGRRWTVARRWTKRRLPRWRRLRGGPDDASWWSFDNLGGFDEAIAGVLIGLAIIALLALFVIFIIPLLVFTIELLIVLLVVLAGAASRILLGRPWTIEAHSAEETIRYQVKGLRTSREKVDEVADAIQYGLSPARLPDAESSDRAGAATLSQSVPPPNFKP